MKRLDRNIGTVKNKTVCFRAGDAFTMLDSAGLEGRILEKDKVENLVSQYLSEPRMRISRKVI